MAVTSVPSVTALPTPPSTTDPGNFDTRADAFLGALPTFQTQTNAVAANVVANATDAANSATAAAGSATTATTKASEASTSASNAATSATNASNSATAAGNSATSASNSASAASTSATNASTSATNASNSATAAQTAQTAAEAARDTAQVYATQQMTATSSTSNSITAGSKNFTVQTNKGFVPGQYLSIANTTTPTNMMQGMITSYNPATGALVVNVDYTQGATGPFTSWSIGVVGRAGASTNRPVIIVTGNLNAVAGNDYVFDGPWNITMPSAPVANDTIGLINGYDAQGPTVDFGTVRVRRQIRGVLTMTSGKDSAVVKYTGNSTIGWVEV